MELISPSVDECLERLNEFSDALDNLGFVIFRNANWSTEDADKFMIAFSRNHGWRVHYENPNNPHWVYVEDHAMTLAWHERLPSSDEIFIHWHAEQMDLEFPQHGSLWQMLEKKGHPDSGQTGFIDNSALYQQLNKSDKEFLSRCEAILIPAPCNVPASQLVDKIIENERGDRVVPMMYQNEVQASFVRPLVQIQKRTGKTCLRFHSHYEEWECDGLLNQIVMTKMVLIDGRVPTPEEEKRADKLLLEIASQIYKDTSIQIWIKWQQGDIILSDLFRMTHGVKGGFAPGERRFRGIWAFNDEPYLPEDPKQIRKYSSLPEGNYLYLD